MSDFEVIVSQQPGEISCNFAEVKAKLSESLAVYRGMIFTEENKSAAKNTVAELRKEKKALADRVKAVKAEYMKPFDTFTDQAKELSDLFDEPIGFIVEQLEDFERRRVEEKKKVIAELYEECIADMNDVLPLKKIYNPKWENATATNKSIREEMMQKKEAAKSAIATIKGMQSEVEDIALNMYKESFDLTRSIQYITNHENQKREILAREQERIRREEEERIRREEREKLEAERRTQEALEEQRRQAETEKAAAMEQAEAEKAAAVEQARAEAAQEVVDSLIPNDLSGESNLYEYRMSLTADAKEKLEMYLESIGIEWELI